MKKLILNLLFITSTFAANAQGITFLDLPVVGELWIEFKDTVGTNITISPSGSNQTWNYLNSFTVHDTIQYLPQNLSTIPSAIANLFPQATSVLAGQNAGDYTFYKTDLTGTYIDGYYSAAGFDVVGNIFNDKNYTNDLLFLPVPFDTGIVVQNTAMYSYVFPDPTLLPGALVKVTYATFQDLDGESQGNLTTPLGNYPSVMRIREMITESILYEIDSFASGNYTYFTDITLPTTVSYKWIKNGPNCVVMTASLDEFNNVTQASYFTSSGLVGISGTNQQNKLSVQPNPTVRGNNITLNLNEAEASSIAIFDLSGRNIYQTQVNKGLTKVEINTALFDAGMYYINVMNNSEVASVLKFSVIE
jgi:hypothetical protein